MNLICRIPNWEIELVLTLNACFFCFFVKKRDDSLSATGALKPKYNDENPKK